MRDVGGQPLLRHCRDGEGLGSGPHQDAPDAAAHRRRSRRVQYRLPQGRIREPAGRGRTRAAIHGYMAYGPPGSQQFFIDTAAARDRPDRILAARISAIACSRRSTALFAAGHASAVVLNSDSPTLPTSLLVETAQVLARPGDRAVLGPSTDGGYYLLGIKQAHRRLFEDIDWSTERVARQTLERAQRDRPRRALAAGLVRRRRRRRRCGSCMRELFEGGSLDPALTPFHAPTHRGADGRSCWRPPISAPGSG